jgi:hypothetical protein
MTVNSIQVYDPPLCCPTGVCGPSIDPALIRFAADLEWLTDQGVQVERYNLAQQPAAFASDAAVRAALERDGEAALPLVRVGGEIRASGAYPSRDELAAWAGLGATPPLLFTELVGELVSIGAAVAANCEASLEFHVGRALSLGASQDDVRRAVETAQSVRDASATLVDALAQRLARPTLGVACAPAPPTRKGSCC